MLLWNSLRWLIVILSSGTLLDGEPIINLPPKVIMLKQVDFTDEERDFYSQLEINSRDQFKVWFYWKWFPVFFPTEIIFMQLVYV